MRKLLSFLLVIFFIGVVCAQCNDGQIDINTAPLEDMMKINGLGGKGIIAGRVIDNRPYSYIDELINVKGIGNKTLEKIKLQGLACVSGDIEQAPPTNPTPTPVENVESTSTTQPSSILSSSNTNNNEINEPISSAVEPQISSDKIEQTSKPITAEIINLNPESKDIKTSENLLKSENVAVYGLIGFSLLIGSLFAMRRIKNPKTEFK